jgi:hypothetical protein
VLVPAILPSVLPPPHPSQAKLMVFFLPAAQVNMLDEEICSIKREMNNRNSNAYEAISLMMYLEIRALSMD